MAIDYKKIKNDIFATAKKLGLSCVDVPLKDLLDAERIQLRNDKEHDYTKFEYAFAIGGKYHLIIFNGGNCIDWKWIGYDELNPKIDEAFLTPLMKLK